MNKPRLYGANNKPLEGMSPKHRATRVITVKSRDRISEVFGMEPADLGSTMSEALGKGVGAWDAYGKLIAAFEHHNLTDGRVRANFDKLTGRIAGMDWQIVASEHDPRGEADADEIQKLFDNIPNFEDDVLTELADAIASGFAAVEPTAELVGNDLVVTSCRGVEQWALRPDEARPGEWEYKDENDWLPVPSGKLITWERRKKGSVITSGLMWPVLWLAMFKSYTFKDWVSFLETYGQPFRLGKYPANVDENSEEFETLLRAVIDIATDAGAVIPAGMSIEFIEAAKGDSDAYERMIKRIDNYFDQLFLGGTLTVEAGDKGARSLGDVHDDQLDEKAATFARGLASALSAWIKRLVIFLHGERQGYPRFAFVTKKVRTMQARMEIDEKLVGLGLKIPARHFYEMYDVPEPEKGEDVIEPPPPGSTPPQPARRNAATASSDLPGAVLAADDTAAMDERTAAEEDALRAGMSESFEAQAVAIYDARFKAIETLMQRGLAAALDGLGNLPADKFTQDFAALLGDSQAAFALAGSHHVWLEGAGEIADGETFPAASLVAEQMIDTLAGDVGRFADRDSFVTQISLPGGEIKTDWRKVTPKKAVEYFAKKTAVPASRLAALTENSRAVAFTIAREENQRVLDTARDTIADALAKGISEGEAIRRMREGFKSQGLTAPSTSHLRTVFRQNTSTAYAAGRFAAQTSPGVSRFLPHLLYIPRRDARPSHAALKGVCLPTSSSLWRTLAPPIDWGCRCRTRSVRRPPAGSITDEAMVPIPAVSPGFQNTNPLETWHDAATGDFPGGK